MHFLDFKQIHNSFLSILTKHFVIQAFTIENAKSEERKPLYFNRCSITDYI